MGKTMEKKKKLKDLKQTGKFADYEDQVVRLCRVVDDKNE